MKALMNAMDSSRFDNFMADELKEIREFWKGNNLSETDSAESWIDSSSEEYRNKWEKDHT